MEIPVQIKAILLVLTLFSSISVPITITNAELTELNVSPEVVVQGEELSLSGLASPDEEVWLDSSFELFLPVSEGKYSREFHGLDFQKGNKSFSVTARNIKNIRLELYPVFGIIFDFPLDGPLNATDGIATVSIFFPVIIEEDNTTTTINIAGEKDVLVYGEALEGATSVKLEFNMSICVTADSDGYFELNLSTTGVPVGEYVLSADGLQKTVQVSSPLAIVDTGSGTYPSVSGVHTGSIKPNKTFNVSKLYTYPCPGTGGHIKSIQLRENNELVAYGEWEGYQSDWHNVTLHTVSGAPYVTLLEDHEYTYTIYTGSYPQIVHKQNHTTLDRSFINCTRFVASNGKVYYDWIPAIKVIGNNSGG
jgi:hypothetical protein